MVTVLNIASVCARCEEPIDRARFRVVRDSELVSRAYDPESGDPDMIFESIDWICSTCAVEESVCLDCGHRLAGILRGWFIDDDGLVTCNPFCPEPWARISCTNEACARVSVHD